MLLLTVYLNDLIGLILIIKADLNPSALSLKLLRRYFLSVKLK